MFVFITYFFIKNIFKALSENDYDYGNSVDNDMMMQSNHTYTVTDTVLI